MDLPHALKEINHLKDRLARTKQEFADYMALIKQNISHSGILASAQEAEDQASTPPKPRDDDTHYFQSYDQHGERPSLPSSPISSSLVSCL